MRNTFSVIEVSFGVTVLCVFAKSTQVTTIIHKVHVILWPKGLDTAAVADYTVRGVHAF